MTVNGRTRNIILGYSELWGRFLAKRRPETIYVERHAYESLVIYEVLSEDLDALERETLSISEDFSFSSVSLAVALSFLIALVTTEIPSNKTFTIFCVLVVVGFISAAYFGVRWLKGRKKFKSVVKRLRSRAGPLGEEGSEIKLAELESLPNEEVGAPEARRP